SRSSRMKNASAREALLEGENEKARWFGANATRADTPGLFMTAPGSGRLIRALLSGPDVPRRRGHAPLQLRLRHTARPYVPRPRGHAALALRLRLLRGGVLSLQLAQTILLRDPLARGLLALGDRLTLHVHVLLVCHAIHPLAWLNYSNRRTLWTQFF